jgi:hypothetical protein
MMGADASARLLFGMCGVGLNVTFAIYLAYINIFAWNFSSRQIMGQMNGCIYVAAFSIVALQMQFGSYLDRRYGSKAWCSMQITAGLIAMGLTLLAIPFAREVEKVYLFGLLIGIFEGGALSALMQLAAAVPGEMTKFVNTGFTLAQVLPIGLSVVLKFPERCAGHTAAIAFAFIPAIFCFTTAVYFIVSVYMTGSFDQTFDKLDAQRQASHSAAGPSGTSDFVCEESPLVPAKVVADASKGASKSTNIWLQYSVLVCALVNFSGHALSMFFMPFLTFVGTMEIAHVLVLVRFGCEFVGRLAAHVVSLERFGWLDNRGLFVLMNLTLVRAAILFALVLGAFGVINLGQGNILLGLTGLFYLLFAWTNSEVMASITKFVPKDREREAMNGMMLLTFGAQLVSLCVGQFVVHQHSASHNAAGAATQITSPTAQPAALDAQTSIIDSDSMSLLFVVLFS